MPSHLLSSAALQSKLRQAGASAKSRGSSVKISDGGGLMLVVRPTGEASWVLRATFKGGRRDFTLGRWPAVSLAAARDLSKAARLMIAKGVDPAEERRSDRQRQLEQREISKHASDTLEKLFEDWMSCQTHLSAVYQGNIEAAFRKDVIPTLGAIPPHLVERDHILAVLRVIEGREAFVLLGRVRMWLRQMFEWGIEHEGRPLLKASPVPTRRLKSFRKARRTRHFPALTNAKDVPDLMRNIRAVTDLVIRNALLFSAYVFQRPSEIREATWDEFDLDSGKWVIPAQRMKLQGEHWVPLAPQVVDMLRHHKALFGHERYLFPGRRAGQPISEATLGSRINGMGFEGKHTPHGFRAMARTIGEECLRIDPKLLEKQLSHDIDTSGLRGAYNRAEHWDERVTMMKRWADWLDQQ